MKKSINHNSSESAEFGFLIYIKLVAAAYLKEAYVANFREALLDIAAEILEFFYGRSEDRTLINVNIVLVL